MKIITVNNLYGTLARGGAEYIAELVADALSKSGNKLKIFSSRPWGTANQQYGKEKYAVYRIPSLYYNLSKVPYFFRYFWHIFDMFDVVSSIRFLYFLKKEKPDLVITHNLKGLGFLLPFAIKLSGIKHIHYLHDIQLIHPSGLVFAGEEDKLDSFGAKAYTLVNRQLIGLPDAVISPSRWLLDEHLSRGFFSKSFKKVILNPVQGAKSQSDSKSSSGIPKKYFEFLFVGQMEQHKGVSLLLDAYILLKKKMSESGSDKELRLTFIGDGNLYSFVEAIAENDQSVKVLGRLAKDQVLDRMNEADCLVVPSLCYENSPTVIYEAFLSGLPVLASEIGGIRELVAEGRGNLFDPLDISSLVNKMMTMTDMNAEKDVSIKKARSFVLKNGLNDYLEVFKSVIKEIGL